MVAAALVPSQEKGRFISSRERLCMDGNESVTGNLLQGVFDLFQEGIVS